MKKLIVFMVLFSCATMNAQMGELSMTDVYCGKVDKIKVYTGAGVQSWPAILTCKEALAMVDKSYTAMWAKAGPLVADWTVIYTMGAPGYALGSTGMIETYATTYPATHVIEVKATEAWATYHEMFHAYEIDYGKSNGHKDWCKKYNICTYVSDF